MAWVHSSGARGANRGDTRSWQRRKDSILAQSREAADMDITMTIEEEMDISLENITAVQGRDDYLLSHETLDGEVLEKLDEEYGEVEEGEASQG